MAFIDILISWWPLNEASAANAIDVHGTNTLTDENGVASDVGVLNGGRLFAEPNDESLSCASNASLQVGDIDFCVGTTVILPDNSLGYSLISKGSDAESEYNLYFLPVVEEFVGYFVFEVYDSSQSSTFIQSSFVVEIDDDSPHFVVAWHDATLNTINIQVDNGTVDSVSHTTGVLAGTGIFRLSGSGDTIQLPLTGVLDEAFFAKGIPTAGERTTLYNSGARLAYPFTGSMGGFDGIIPIGFYALMLEWSGAAGPIPPISGGNSKLPWTRRRRG